MEMTLGDRILFARRKAGLHQTDIAKGTGLSREAVSAWETGKSNPTAVHIPVIAGMLNVSTDWLLTGEAAA